MPTIVEESTITSKGQTTVPKAVRKALGVDYGGKIAYRIDDDGVRVQRVGGEEEDPALGRFLEFLARDIGQRPQALKAFTPEFAARIAELTQGVAVDLDEPIEGDVAL